MKLSGTEKLAGYTFCLLVILSHLSAAEEVKPLESYPEANRIWMGLEEGSIRPAAYNQVRAPIDGYLSLHAEDGQLLKKGDLWAVMDPEQIEIERRSLDLEIEKLQQKMDKVTGDTLDAQLRQALEIHKTEGKRQTLVDASQNPSIPGELRKRASDAITKIDERLELLRKQADPETIQRDVDIAKAEGELLVTQRRKQFHALEKRSRLIADFDGEIRFGDLLKQAVAEREKSDALLWVSANDHLATLVDDSRFEIVVKATSPVLSQITPEDLLVFLQEPTTGHLIAGDYSRTDEVDTGGEIIQNYIFSIQDASIKDARHSSARMDWFISTGSSKPQSG